MSGTKKNSKHTDHGIEVVISQMQIKHVTASELYVFEISMFGLGLRELE
jgi:hypothetical protein